MLSLSFASLAILASTVSAAHNGYPYGRFPEPITTDITVSGAFETCNTVTFDWSNASIPVNSAEKYTLRGFLRKEIAGGPTIPRQQWPEPVVEITTPSTSASWLVDYPAGASLEFVLSSERSWTGGWSPEPIVSVEGRTAELTVGKSNSTTCVPHRHIPILVNVDDEFIPCNEVTFEWEGGEAPYSIHIFSGQIDHGHLGWENYNFINQKSFVWTVTYPTNAFLQYRVRDNRGTASVMYNAHVGNPLRYTDERCIPRNHRPYVRSGWRHPGAIASYVILGLILINGISFAIYVCWRRHRVHKQGSVQLM